MFARQETPLPSMACAWRGPRMCAACNSRTVTPQGGTNTDTVTCAHAYYYIYIYKV